MSIDDDARAVGEYMRHGGGWGIGYKVAKWVHPLGKGQTLISANAPIHKVHATEFALKAGVDKNRITRYLRAWDAAAKELGLPHSSEILPDTEWTPDEDALGDWSHYLRLGKKREDRTADEQAQIAVGALATPRADGASPGEIAEANEIDPHIVEAAAKTVRAAIDGPSDKSPKDPDSELVKLKKRVTAMLNNVIEYDTESVSQVVQKRGDAEIMYDLFESINEWSGAMMKEMEAKVSAPALRAV